MSDTGASIRPGTFRTVLRDALRMLARDWRAGELNMLLAALMLAVAALTSVGFVADRMRLGLERDARDMLAADLRIRSDQPLDPVFAARARAEGLRTATTTVFPSMIAAGGGQGDAAHPQTPQAEALPAEAPRLRAPQAGQATAAAARSDNVSPDNPSPDTSPPAASQTAAPVTRLAALKAVSPGYPLRGAVRIAVPERAAADAPNLADHAAAGLPEPGTVWVDAPLLDALHVGVGQTVRVGTRTMRIAAIITRELDRGFSFVNFSPRVMMRADELASTGLVGYGSRVNYRLLVAGPDAAMARYTAWAHAQVDGGKRRGIAFETLEDGQPQVRETLDRARHFLTLVALLTALLAAVAIGMAAHRFMQRHLDGCAVMRCLGASARTLRTLFAIEFLAVGICGSLAGAVLGYGGHLALLSALGNLISVALPAPSAMPVITGVATGVVLLLGAALPPLLPLTRVPPVHVLRRALRVAKRPAWGAYACGVLLFAALLVAGAGQLKLGLIVAGGFAAGVLVFAALSRLVLWALARIARRGGAGVRIGWRYALASLERRKASSVLQITALGIGLMCLLLLAMTRQDLIAGWRKSTPADAFDHFIIDIQPDQAAGVGSALAAARFGGAELAPMVRGRLVAVNGKAVDPAGYDDDNARRLVDREFNLSYTARLPADNRVVGGRWFGDGTRPAISIEEGIAKTLHVKLGDTLRFGVAGQFVEAPVTSLRKLDWGTFRVNFFVLMPPATLAGFPATFITSFKLPAGGQHNLDALVGRFPNLTVIDTRAILAQLQHVLDQVIGAVQFLFLFTLASGILVLYAALAGSRDERVQEAALLRALGASGRQIRSVQLAEFLCVGALAGALAGGGAQAIGFLLATHVFDFKLSINPVLLLTAVLGGMACALGGGVLGLLRVLRRPALESLRES